MNRLLSWRKRIPQRQKSRKFTRAARDARGGYSPVLMAVTSVTQRRTANAAATANIVLVVHRALTKSWAIPEARSPPEGPMRGRAAIARRRVSLFICLALSFSRSLSPALSRGRRDITDTHFARRCMSSVWCTESLDPSLPPNSKNLEFLVPTRNRGARARAKRGRMQSVTK